VSQRKVIGLVLGSAAYNYTFYLLLTWGAELSLEDAARDLLHSVFYASVPWLSEPSRLLVGGWLVNFLIQRGWNSSRVRQTVLIGGTSFGLGIFGAAGAHTPGDAFFG